MAGGKVSVIELGFSSLLLCSTACTPPLIGGPCNPYYSAAARAAAFPNFDAATGTLNGDLTITSDQNWLDYFCVQHVNGNLAVSGNNSFQVGVLIRLQSVTGNVSLDYNLHNSTPATGSDPRIRVFGLPALQSVGGNLEIVAADTGTDTSNDGANAIGIDALTSVGGTIRFSWLIGHYNPTGLAGLSTHNGNVEIRLYGDQSDLGLMSHLGTVQGNVTFNPGATTVTDILSGLTTVGGTFRIEEDCSPTVGPRPMGPGWFNTLQTIGGDLVFYQTTHLAYFGMMIALNSVGGVWQLQGTALQKFPIVPTANLVVGGVHIENNAKLTQLSSSQINVVPNGPIVIDNNCTLTASIATQFVNDEVTGGWTGAPDVHDNGAGPATCTACFALNVTKNALAP